MSQLDELCSLLGSHVLRRLKADVEQQLLPREETIIYVELTKCQKAFYRAVYEKNTDILFAKTRKLKSLRNVAMTLRKVCLHPYLLHGAEEEELTRNGIKLPPQISRIRLRRVCACSACCSVMVLFREHVWNTSGACSGNMLKMVM